MTIWQSVKNWFSPPYPEEHWRDIAEEAALKKADETFREMVKKTNDRLVAYREFKPCPSCRGTDILAGYSIRKGKEEVWCDECSYLVDSEDPYVAMALWNSQPRNPEQD